MTDDLYERYKEALRTGHVGVLRGSLEEALAAYRVAAEIAPSRALPHTSLGGVYMRLGHLEDALIEYAAAVASRLRLKGTHTNAEISRPSKVLYVTSCELGRAVCCN